MMEEEAALSRIVYYYNLGIYHKDPHKLIETHEHMAFWLILLEILDSVDRSY
jgi:hypothetical protein